jgi:FlgN protein.
MDKQAEAAFKRATGMLEAILTRQIELHKKMLVVADGKTEAIVKGALEQLEQTVQEERKLVQGIEEEENARLAVMPLIKAQLGLDPSVEKLADIIDAMPEPEKTTLTPIRAALKDVIEQCHVKTRHNAELLKASLEHVEGFLRTLSEAVQTDVKYDAKGKRIGGGPSLLDKQG